MDFTLILITKNRANIAKCLNSIYDNLEKLKFKLIIIDGNKNNLLEDQIKESTLQDHDIKIYKQKKDGFMRACFQSIGYVKTKFFSFIYDDDVLSEYYYKMIISSTKGNMLTLGKGSVESIEKNINFIDPEIKECLSSKRLVDYYTFSTFKKKNLPNSPICSVFKSSILTKWEKFLLHNCRNNRDYFNILMKKNIGPDLLLYLMSLDEEFLINSTNTIMSKFSHHNNSMSVRYGSVSLIFGYLVTKILFFKSIYKKMSHTKRLKFKTYLIIQLFYVIIRNIIKKNNLNFKVFKISLKEIYNLIRL